MALLGISKVYKLKYLSASAKIHVCVFKWCKEKEKIVQPAKHLSCWVIASSILQKVTGIWKKKKKKEQKHKYANALECLIRTCFKIKQWGPCPWANVLLMFYFYNEIYKKIQAWTDASAKKVFLSWNMSNIRPKTKMFHVSSFHLIQSLHDPAQYVC